MAFHSSAIAVSVPGPHGVLFQAWVHLAFTPPTGAWTLPREELDFAHVAANSGAVGVGLELTVRVVQPA